MTLSASSSVEQMPEWVAILAEHLPQVDDLVTEDDTPVDNLFSAKQQRLLVEPLYTSWAGPDEGRPFLIEANIGVFYSVHQPPLVPDVMLSVEAQWPDDVWTKTKHAYCIWNYGKLPEVVIDLITDQHSPKGEHKFHDYAWVGIPFCIVVDPTGQLGAEPLRVYSNSRSYPCNMFLVMSMGQFEHPLWLDASQMVSKTGNMAVSKQAHLMRWADLTREDWGSSS